MLPYESIISIGSLVFNKSTALSAPLFGCSGKLIEQRTSNLLKTLLPYCRNNKIKRRELLSCDLSSPDNLMLRICNSTVPHWVPNVQFISFIFYLYFIHSLYIIHIILSS